jgi:hypothetical protein
MAGRRGLTAGEVALARQAFGDSIPYPQIELIDGSAGNPIAAIAFRNGNSAITLGPRVHFQPVRFLADFSTAKPAARGLLVHELTHVWQYRRLGMIRFFARYAREYAGSGFNAGRMYDYDPGMTRFQAARLEAQARMAGDYTDAVAAGDTERQGKLRVNLAGSGLYGL